jgi:hypothetical protein
MRFLTAAALAAGLLAAGAARAQDEASAQAAVHWRALTALDVDAAYRLLKENHPGAAAETGDRAFVAALEAAHAKALSRAEQVTGLPGYLATLGGFAGAMGDGHIGSGPAATVTTLRWTGVVPARRGAAWVAASVDAKLAPGVAAGARIVSCDGRAFDEIAHEAVGFRTDATVDATLVIQGAWALTDDGNPFVVRPKACVFESDGKTVSVPLKWTAIPRTRLVGEIWKRPYGAAGFGLRASGQGFWVGVQALDPRAQASVDAVAARQGEVRAAPWLVVDLRGDGGGDDSYAQALAVAVYGAERVRAALGQGPTEGGGCDSVFRASPANIAETERLAGVFEAQGDAVGAGAYRRAIVKMKAAAAAGHALTGPLACPSDAAKAAPPGPALMRGRVFVLTDAVCFSSCLQAVEFFRALGAVQIGQATGADTRYSEYRQVTLPSGLSAFSTLQAVMPDHPRRIGPYVPDIPYDGDMADTGALEAWVQSLSSQH